MRNAGNAGAILLATAGLVFAGEIVREVGLHELKDKPALKDKVNDVKTHQKDLRGVIEDAYAPPLGAAEAAPIDRKKVKQFRAIFRKTGSLDKAVPPVVTHEEFKGGGSATIGYFKSEGSRQATVNALEDTIQATEGTKLDKNGLDKIFGTYETELAEERGTIARQEEKAIATGLQDVHQGINRALNNKPLVRYGGWDTDLYKNIGLTYDGSGTADYPKGNHSPLVVPDDVYPNTVPDALAQLAGQPDPGDIQMKLPQ